MNKLQFQEFVNEFVAELRKVAPYDTGNLANNAIIFRFLGDNIAEIEISLDIAPYMPYTNEPWISPRWNVKKNPNEAWFQTNVQKIIDKLAKKYGGILK